MDKFNCRNFKLNFSLFFISCCVCAFQINSLWNVNHYTMFSNYQIIMVVIIIYQKSLCYEQLQTIHMNIVCEIDY